MTPDERRYTRDDLIRALNILVLSGMLTAEINDDGDWTYKHSKKMSASSSIMTFAQFMLEERYDTDEE
jgi:hypothetical protein